MILTFINKNQQEARNADNSASHLLHLKLQIFSWKLIYCFLFQNQTIKFGIYYHYGK